MIGRPAHNAQHCQEARCGDSFLWEEVEECDDGNTMSGDGCSASCRLEEQEPVCGNGRVEAGEACDDGNRDDGDGCDSMCREEQQGPPDHGDTAAEAMRITVPAEVSAALDSGTDRDYFRFFATTGNYTVYTTGNADTICAEFSGNPLTTDDDSGEGSTAGRPLDSMRAERTTSGSQVWADQRAVYALRSASELERPPVYGSSAPRRL